MAAYFDRKQIPKVLITTSYKCTLVVIDSHDTLSEIVKCECMISIVCMVLLWSRC